MVFSEVGEPLDAVDSVLVGNIEAQPGDHVLIIDSRPLAQWALEQGYRVSWFCDDARAHAEPIQGTNQLEPDQSSDTDIAEAWVNLPVALDALDEYSRWFHALGIERVVTAGRIKHLSPTMNEVLGRRYETVFGSLGVRKSRALIAEGLRAKPAGGAPWPRLRSNPETGLVLASHGGTFASGRVDPGTRLLLGALDECDDLISSLEAPRLVDWGSGCGVIAAVMAQRWPQAEVMAVDSSWAGARATARTAAENSFEVSSTWSDGVAWLAAQPIASLDLVVSNPPFHRGPAKESGPTLDMFRAAAQALKDDGALLTVHNSHLPWERALEEDFAEVERLVQNRHYSVTLSRRPRG